MSRFSFASRKKIGKEGEGSSILLTLSPHPDGLIGPIGVIGLTGWLDWLSRLVWGTLDRNPESIDGGRSSFLRGRDTLSNGISTEIRVKRPASKRYT